TIRAEQSPQSWPHLLNSEVEFDSEVSWTTYPERLEEAGVSWKIYQNELAIRTELAGEAEAWLSNFGDNPIEHFQQYGVRFAAAHRAYLQQRRDVLRSEIATLEKEQAAATL